MSPLRLSIGLLELIQLFLLITLSVQGTTVSEANLQLMCCESEGSVFSVTAP